MTQRVVVYSRVSTDAQERDGTSLDTQERACVEFARERGWSVVLCVRDSASGAILDREGLDEARRLARAGEADVVLAYAIDRLARDQVKLATLYDELNSVGVALETVTEPFDASPMGMFIMNARALVAAVEREKIAERTMRGKAERARSGRIPQATGLGCYGYVYERETGRRDMNEPQAEVVRRIFTLFVEGRGVSAIAKALNDDAIPAFSGGVWYPLTVRRILANETYTGRTIYRKTRAVVRFDHRAGKRRRFVEERDESEQIEVHGATPRIIDDATFQRARHILDDPSRRDRFDRSGRYALKGRIRCLSCGAAMVGHAAHQGKYRYYHCPNGSSGPGITRCEARYIRADEVEQAVRERVAEVLADPERLIAEVRRRYSSTQPGAERERIGREIGAVRLQRDRLLDAYLAGTFDRDTLDERSKALERRQRALERDFSARSPDDDVDITEVESTIEIALQRVSELVAACDGETFDLVLRALDVRVRASRDEFHVEGSLPGIESVPLRSTPASSSVVADAAG